MPNWKRVRTPTWLKPSYRNTKRIKIEQSVDRPVHVRTQDMVRRKLMRDDPWWFNLHKRGLRRTNLAGDPREAAAVSKEQVLGTLPERIVYKMLRDVFHQVDGVDFTFQSSLQGGRMETGGIVADFILPLKMIVIQVQGPTHNQYLRMRKDVEQRSILKDMGYDVYEIDDDLIYDIPRLEDYLRRILGVYGSRGSAGTYERQYRTVGMVNDDGIDGEPTEAELQTIVDAVGKLERIVHDFIF